MLSIALRHVPNACCIVPERREERTTEGGLDINAAGDRLRHIIEELKAAGIRVSLFVEPDERAIAASADVGADIVELHTGAYCERALEDDAKAVAYELKRIEKAAACAAAAGLEVHAGHGLTYNTVKAIARLPEIVELNIGHFLVGEAIFGGLNTAVRHMRELMFEARRESEARANRTAGEVL
jgi:pyridoxine 5-phosphate synthase